MAEAPLTTTDFTESEPSASRMAGRLAWVGLLLVAAPLVVAGLLGRSTDTYLPAAAFFMLCMGYGGVVTGALEAAKRGYTGLVVSACALAVALLLSGIAAVLQSEPVARYLLLAFPFALPFLFGPVIAPIAVSVTQARKTSSVLILVGFWLVPSLGIVGASFASPAWRIGTPWAVLVILVGLQLGPWLRPFGKLIVPFFPFLGSPPASYPGDWVDVPVAMLISAHLIALIVVFLRKPRLRSAMIIPYASMAALWAVLGMLQLVRWIHQGE